MQRSLYHVGCRLTIIDYHADARKSAFESTKGKVIIDRMDNSMSKKMVKVLPLAEINNHQFLFILGGAHDASPLCIGKEAFIYLLPA